MSREGKTEDDRDDWLVPNRNRIQSLSLIILRILKDKESAIAQNAQACGIAGLVIGVAFSLWRAVFITHQSQDWEHTINTGVRYIRKVIRTNTILANDDAEMRDWAFGYYSNNSYYRLRDMCDRIPQIRAALKERSLDIYDGRAHTHLEETSQIWEQHCSALEVAVAWLADNLSGLTSPQSN